MTSDHDLVAVVAAAASDGSPITGHRSGDHLRIAAVARRRWASQARRLPPDADRDRRVEDLAKGLVAVCEPDRHLVGPLVEDYRHLARLLAAVLASP